MEIQKSGDDREQYKKEINEGLQIFEKDFKGIQDSKKFPEKQMEYEKSATEALTAVQDAINALVDERLKGIKSDLDKDYQAYLSDPNDSNRDKVEKDVSALRDAYK